MIFEGDGGRLLEVIAAVNIRLGKLARMILKKHGLTYSQFGALLVLTRCDGINQKELSKYLETDTTNTMVICEGLEKKGLIERHQSDEDRRSNILSITPLGSELFEKSLPDLAQIYVPVMSALNTEETKSTTENLQKLLNEVDLLLSNNYSK
jgi:DNA-binding MarR family transcriptional regulator